MNVLQFICPVGLHGAEMWILALAKNFDPRKINCQLAVTLESEDQNIEIYHRFRALYLEAHQVKMRGRFDPKGIMALCRLIREKKIDIIHTHGYKSDILGLIAARITGIKALSTPHGFDNSKDSKLQLFIKLGCLSLRFLYVGQLIYRKRVDHLIDTFDLLYREHKNIRLIIIGGGPKRSELEEKARSLPSASRIEFLGYREDRLRLLRELNLFCMTSSLEGIPRCMMEAMGMGIPVAAYNIPGVDKLIIHGKTGLMAEFGQVEELKECWKRLLFDEKFSTQIAQNGRKHILENFSAKRMAEEYTHLYGEMMSDI